MIFCPHFYQGVEGEPLAFQKLLNYKSHHAWPWSQLELSFSNTWKGKDLVLVQGALGPPGVDSHQPQSA